MGIGRRNLRQSVRKLDLIKSNKDALIPGSLGITLGGERRVEVPGRDGYVYVRLRDNLNEVVQAYNGMVSTVYDLAVLVVRDDVNKNVYRIHGRDLGRYQNWGTSAYIARHGDQHSFNPDSPGNDITWVWGRQFMPLAAIPSGSNGAPNVIIEPSTYYQNKNWFYAGGTGTANITPYKPTGSNARMVLVYLDESSNPQLLGGDTYFAASITGTSQIIPYLPSLPDTSVIPIAGIRLVSGTSKILWDNIYDIRPHLVGDGFVATGTSGHIIQSDSVDVDQRPYLNFLGDGFVVWNDADSTNISGTASGGGAAHTIQDDGVSQTQRTNLNFVGTGFSLWDDAGNDATIVSGTTAGHIIAEDGTPLTARPVLDFTGGLVAYDDPVNAKTIVSGTASTAGHIIQDDGAVQTQRANLNFIGSGFNIWDDAGNNATIVSGTTAGHIVLNGGTPVTQRPAISFIGGITAYDDPINSRTIVSGSASAAGGGHTIQDSGVGLTQRANLNFIGAGFYLWDDSGNDATIVSGTATVAGGGHTIQDDGSPLTGRSNLNFVGSNFVVYDNAGGDATIVSGTASGGGSETRSAFFSMDGYDGNVGNFPTRASGVGATARRVVFTVPSDFASLVSLSLWILPTLDSTTQNFDLASDYGAVGEAYNVHSSSANTGALTLTANQLYKIDVAGIFGSLAVGDICGLASTKKVNEALVYLGLEMVYQT